jgi:hypothetical protein
VKHRVSMLLAASLLASPSFAAPVFMLQFGSFESRDEAEAKLSELKGKHAGVLSGMSSGIREVALPPDNLTVYRTQAGPVDTRGSAQSICSQLASNGDECYVVETAMVPAMSPPRQQVASAVNDVVGPATAATAAATSAAATSAAATSVAAPSIPSVVTAVAPRDPQSMAMLNSVTSGPNKSMNAPLPDMEAPSAPAVAATATAAAPIPSSSLQAAMNDAAAEQQKALALNAAPTPADAKPEGSFWGRLNPFSSSTAPTAVAAAPAAPKELPAPKLTPMADAKAPPAPVLPEPTPETVAIAQKAQAAVPTPAPVAAPVPVLVPTPEPAPAMAATPRVITQADPLPLPPPPAPLIGKGAIASTSAAAPMVMAANTNTAASLRAPSPVITPQPTGTMPAPLIVPPPGTLQSGNGQVNVGEAQRVPLSQPPVLATPVASAPMPVPSSAPVVMSLSPSATIGQKTLWAEIGPFVDAQAALGYWDNYRRTHPDFPVVRVRVASSYMAVQRGISQVSLRIGPVLKPTAITNLCKTLPEEPRVRCGQVTDMGTATQMGGPRNGYMPGSRYQR